MIETLLDPYELKAGIAPGVIFLLPASVDTGIGPEWNKI
jgi:hypothetical protein